MTNSENLKQLVREKYAAIALQNKEDNQSSCCGSGGNSAEVYNIMTDDYSKVDGYTAEADLGLGCGLPTQFAQISEGDTVIDLGSGAGNDCFVARNATGPSGKVIGIDFTPEMIRKARINAENLGFNNVEFREGDIEAMPVSDNTADVVVSNCVLNLVPHKKTVIAEIYRVLKPGGHFSISDIVLLGELPQALKQDAEMYAGCVSGAIQKEEYLDFIQKADFENVTLQKEKPVFIPDDILSKYLSTEEILTFRSGETGILSITVFASKPGEKKTQKPKLIMSDPQGTACNPNSGCC